MVMVEMKVLVMVMMIPMKSSAMAIISPLREGISPADSCLPESFSLSSIFHPAEMMVSISEPPSHFGFRER
jgi:hypothetical protein